jgi:hypothetical protein
MVGHLVKGTTWSSCKVRLALPANRDVEVNLGRREMTAPRGIFEEMVQTPLSSKFCSEEEDQPRVVRLGNDGGDITIVEDGRPEIKSNLRLRRERRRRGGGPEGRRYSRGTCPSLGAWSHIC